MAIRYLMFDFFGTLVQYRDGVSENPTGRSLRFLQSIGIAISEHEFAARFQEIWDTTDREARLSLRESHMHEIAARLFDNLGRRVSETQVAEFAAQYIEDWSEGVLAIDGISAILGEIGFPSSIVSNTYSPSLVPSLVQRFGLTDCFERIVTSVDHGYRKPHRSIYHRALNAAAVVPEEVLFVGDNPECDFHAPRQIGMQAVLISATPREDVEERHRLPNIENLPAHVRWLGAEV
jgi:putative hydrolase of the HAD superfamily